MIVTRYAYSMMNADLVELPDGEILNFPDASGNKGGCGVFVYAGRVEETTPNSAWGVREYTGQFHPDATDGLKGLKAVGDTKWVCIAQNDDVRKDVTQLRVDGLSVLPAGSGFFVLEGSVEADGKTANQFQFFKPRATDLELQGTGTLVLIR